jgi:hypothetical protein
MLAQTSLIKLTLTVGSDGYSNFSTLPNNLSWHSYWWISTESLIQMTVNNTFMDHLESIAFKDYQGPLVDMFCHFYDPYVREIGEEAIGPYASECVRMHYSVVRQRVHC